MKHEVREAIASLRRKGARLIYPEDNTATPFLVFHDREQRPVNRFLGPGRLPAEGRHPGQGHAGEMQEPGT